MFDWDDLRFFLAFGRTGSLVGAALAAHATESTVGRRLKALEANLGVSLVLWSRSSCSLSAEGRLVMAQAEIIEAEIVKFKILAEQARELLPESPAAMYFEPWLAADDAEVELSGLLTRFRGHRVACQVGGCNHRRSEHLQDKGSQQTNDEWICRMHWRIVPMQEKEELAKRRRICERIQSKGEGDTAAAEKFVWLQWERCKQIANARASPFAF